MSAILDFKMAALHYMAASRSTFVVILFFDQTPSVQASFVKDVRSLVSVIEEMGNPFEEESQDLVILDTKNIARPAAVETVINAKRIGQEQFEAFTRECLLDRTSDISTPP